MTDAFISYSRRDKEFVQALNAAFKTNHRDTWIDWEGIPLGTEWWLEIEAGIEAADTFLFVVTPNSLASVVCKQEIDHAVLHHKRILPIVRQDTDMNLWPAALAKHNALFFRETDDFDTAFTALVKTLDTDLKHVRAHTRLLLRAIEWERADQDSSFLLRDRDLADSERWLEQAVNKAPHPTDQQLQYITASQQLRAHLQAEAAAHQRTEQELKRALVYRRPKLRTVLWASLAVTAGLLVARSFGFLQPLELAAYDQLMRLRPSEARDPRFLIIEVTEDDIQKELQERGTSLSDASLDRLLKQLNQYQPRLIGLDLYRDFNPKFSSLAQQLRQNDRIYGVCKTAEISLQGRRLSDGTPMPKEIVSARVGFSDTVADQGGGVRRHLLLQEVVPNTQCTSEYAFSLVLAQRYLALAPGAKAQAKQPLPTAEQLGENDLHLGGIALPRLLSFMGRSQGVTDGYQILLNYRDAADPQQDPFERISLAQVLNGSLTPAALKARIKDKIVLVGVTASTGGRDYAPTPYGTGSEELPGVILQAHMTSQLLSAVLDRRPLLWVWPQPVEALWIWGWSLAGGLLAWRLQRLPILSIAVVAKLAGLTVICFVICTQAGWVPLIPSGLGVVGTSGLLVYLAFRRPHQVAPLAQPPAPVAKSANRVG
jgi:CHASE2 domain-containing sensor protein